MRKTSYLLVMFIAIGVVMFTGCGGGSAEKSKDESADIKIQTSEGKANVKLPGIDIKADEKGAAKINMPGINIDADEKGNAKLNIGGLNIDVSSDGENSKVKMDGLEVSSDGENGTVKMEDDNTENEGE